MEVLRYAAFTRTPDGGNPAGVVLDATGVADEVLQSTATAVGYSETAFLLPRPSNPGEADVRYFSPRGEVPFCGHATIAAAVAHAERNGPGEILLHTLAGPVAVVSSPTKDGELTATLTSVPPTTRAADAGDLSALLPLLRWSADELDPSLPPRIAYAGAWHPVLAARTRERLADLAYDVDGLGVLMAERGWTTLQLVWRESPTVFHARNPFPPGGVVEDPATGAAAAALGGYLRALGLVEVPATVTIHQGHDLGRPSLLQVGIPADPGSGIEVTGTAVRIPWAEG